MDEIYFLVLYMPIWSCCRELALVELSALRTYDINEHINENSKICPLSRPHPAS